MPDSTTRRPLIGRADEMSILDDVILTARNGRPGAALVRGESGMGKTTLLRETAHRAEATVLWAGGGERGTTLDHGLSAQLLAGSALTTEGPLRGLGRRGQHPVDAFTVGAALLDHLGDLAVERPVVVLVDDAHLADLVSLHALTFAARRLAADAVGLVVTTQVGDAFGSRLPAGLLQLATTTGRVIDLEGLTPAAVAELVGTVVAQPVSLDAGRRLHEHTGGNPLHTLWLLGELPAESLGGGDQLPAPASFTTLVGSRLASCSPAAEKLVTALSVLGVRAPLDHVATVAGVEASPGTVDELTARGFVTRADDPMGPLLTFAHRSVQASLYAGMAVARRRTLHIAAAALLGGEEGLRHRLAAASGADAALAEDAGRAAERARDQGALTEASQLLFELARVAGSRDECEDALMQAVELLLDAGEPAAHWSERVGELRPTARRSYVLGRLLVADGRTDEGRDLIERAWHQLDGSTSDTASSKHLAGSAANVLALIAVDQRSPAAAELWARRALAASEDVPAVATLAHALRLDGRAVEVDAELAPYLSDDSEVVGFGDGDNGVRSDALLGRAVSRLVINDLDGAAADLTEVSRAVAEGATGQLVSNLRTHLAELHFQQGRWATALDVAELAASLAEDAGAPWLAAGPWSIAASISANCGDQQVAAAHAARATEGARASSMRMPWLWARLASLRLAEAVGDHAAVVAAGDQLVADGWAALPAGLPHWQTPYIEGLVAVGRLDDAVVAVAELEVVSGNGDSPVNTALATEMARATAAVATAQGDDAAAATALESALALDAALARPFPRARLELVAGAYQRRTGSRHRAARLFERAASRFQRLGAQPWIDRCERELVACGLRPAARRAERSMVLTAQERVIANMVGAGRTNREVAGELVISVKTVEHHLAGIYAKLDVGSPTELAALLATGGP